MGKEQKKVTVQGILGYLKKGMTRQEIAEELELPMSDIRRIFQHPKLVGKRPTIKPGFVLIDLDEEELQGDSEKKLPIGGTQAENENVAKEELEKEVEETSEKASWR